jgi:hypothetical protein
VQKACSVNKGKTADPEKTCGVFPIFFNFEWTYSLIGKFYHGLKEHHKISNIPKFRCEMLQNAYDIALRSLPFFSHFVLRTGN